MKQIYIENQEKDQVYQNYRDASSESHRPTNRIQSDTDLPNIFLIQNKGKGPPGRMRAPVLACCLSRVNKPVAFSAWCQSPSKEIENKLMTHINKSKFYHN